MDSYNMQIKYNTICVAIFFMLPSILYPINELGLAGVGIICSVVLLSFLLLINRHSINRNAVTFFLIYSLLISVKLITSYESIVDFYLNCYTWLSRMGFGVIGLFIASMKVDLKRMMWIMQQIAAFNVAVYIVLLNNDLFMNIIQKSHVYYMTLGFSLMIPLSVLLIYIYQEKRNILRIILILIYIGGVYILIVYGNRGAWFCHTIVWLYLLYDYVKKQKMFICGILVMSFMLININKFMINDFIEKNFDWYYTYSLWKLHEFIETGNITIFLSGREKIYEYAYNHVFDNIWFGGNIGHIHEISSSYHNIFLEILCDYGMFVFFFMVIFLLYLLYGFFKKNEKKDCLVIIVFISCASMQLTSGYMFLERDFMFLIGILMNKGQENDRI